MVSPLLNVRICCSAVCRAAAADAGHGLKPESCMSKPGIRLAACTMFPFENSAGPDTETDDGKLTPVFIADTASATRPAHPVDAELEGTPACIWICWSACEKRFVGSGTAFAWYCRRVVGCTSIPTFATTASFFCAQKGW